MKAVSAFLLYLITIFAFLHSWLLMSFLATTLFSLRFGAVAFIPTAIIIDGYFGNYHTFPFLSFISIIWYLLIEFLRPKIANFDPIEL